MSLDCEKCQHLQLPFELNSDEQLNSTIVLVKENLLVGNLLDITEPAHNPLDNFNTLPKARPWPNYVEHYFCCSSSSFRFRLSADCLRNVVGEWEPYN